MTEHVHIQFSVDVCSSSAPENYFHKPHWAAVIHMVLFKSAIKKLVNEMENYDLWKAFHQNMEDIQNSHDLIIRSIHSLQKIVFQLMGFFFGGGWEGGAFEAIGGF